MRTFEPWHVTEMRTCRATGHGMRQIKGFFRALGFTDDQTVTLHRIQMSEADPAAAAKETNRIHYMRAMGVCPVVTPIRWPEPQSLPDRMLR